MKPFFKQKACAYIQLLRWHKPIGIFLLLWPTLVALWIASGGVPEFRLLTIFILGTVLMRSAGCVVNDLADRDVDGSVTRTCYRPLVSGRVTYQEAWVLALVMLLIAGLLIYPLNGLTWQLAGCAVFLAISYPLLKRFFPVPQAYLGIAFGFGMPMAFAAVSNRVPLLAWILLFGNVFWTLAYDTAYALVDREDDEKIGIYTAARTFGKYDIAAIMLSYTLFLAIIAYVGISLDFRWPYWLAWLMMLIGMLSHYRLLRTRCIKNYFAVFMQNNYLGLCWFLGVVGSYLL